MNWKRSFGLIVISALLIGSVMAQGGGGQGRGQGRGMGRGNSMSGLLNRADVKAELKITADQEKQLEALRGPGGGGQGRGAGGGGGAGAGGGQGMDREAMMKAMQEREAKILAVLDSKQQSRLKELWIQRVGNAAILREDIQKALDFKADQVEKVKALQAKQQEANQAIMEKMRNGEIERDQIQELRQKNEKIMNEELGKIMTEGQASKLKSMGGAAFTFKDAN